MNTLYKKVGDVSKSGGCVERDTVDGEDIVLRNNKITSILDTLFLIKNIFNQKTFLVNSNLVFFILK